LIALIINAHPKIDGPMLSCFLKINVCPWLAPKHRHRR